MVAGVEAMVTIYYCEGESNDDSGANYRCLFGEDRVSVKHGTQLRTL
jgi:hypothetical protein